MNIKINERIWNDIIIVLYSTGIKATNRREWLPHKCNVRKGIKIHVTVDIKKKKIVSLDVTSEEVYDGNRLTETNRRCFRKQYSEKSNCKRSI
ncbi:MAG: hypothetical protein WB988_09020 [Candidatus Nitrosopolaris sp.]